MRPLLRSEWTKLRTLAGSLGCLLGAAVAIVGIALLISSGSSGVYRDADYVDEFRFAHRPMAGDGEITTRVRAQDAGNPWAMAGLMVKQSPVPGAPYAALAVTKGHGVRMQAGFTTDIAGSAHPTPRHLKLTRTGNTITGYESADGEAWTRVGTVTLAGLPPAVEVGVFVTSPGITRVHPMRPALVQVRPSTATFDRIAVSAAGQEPWTAEDIGGRPAPATAVDPGGEVTLTGSGDVIGRADDGSRVVAATAGTVFAVLPVIVLGVLVVTAEYRWGTILAALTADPRRGRLLAAKVAVVAAVTFPVGLVATAAALLLTQPLLRRNGFRAPVYPDPSLADPVTLRVVAGTAAVLTLLALLGLALGTILRRSAGAITLLAAAVYVPIVGTPFLPADAVTWVQRLTPLAGLSVQQVRAADDTLLLPWSGHPWGGLAILGGYTAVALAFAYVRLRRTDA